MAGTSSLTLHDGDDEQVTPFHLRGLYRPVTEEVTHFDLPVLGDLPHDLDGVLLRNGPNPRARSGHWFLGEGMVHGVRLSEGRARWYRNRWVRNRSFTGDTALVHPDGTVDLTAGPSNTHVIRHAGRILALVESSFPYELDEALATVGPFDFEGRLTTAMTAHPKRCPTTGELHFFGYGFAPPYLTYHRADASGRLELSRVVDVPGPTMIHDMALTERFVVLLDLPMVFDLERALAGTMPYRFDASYGARVGLLARDDPRGEVRWFEVEPCYVFHVLNAFDSDPSADGGEGEARVVLDVVRYDRLWERDSNEFTSSTLWRWELDLRTGRAIERQVDDMDVEFPRVDERMATRHAARGWAVALPGDGGGRETGDAPSRIVEYSLGSAGSGTPARTSEWAFPAGTTPGEAVFAPGSGGGSPGDPGWLLSIVHDASTDASHLAVFSSEALADGPVARVPLPQRVPAGFHGSWLADGTDH